jgi:hypothetical protein
MSGLVTPRYGGVIGCAVHFVQILGAACVRFGKNVSASGEGLDGGGIAG